LVKAGSLALLLLSLPAAAGAQTANPPAAIVAAAADCWQATGATTIDLAKLKNNGWVEASLKDKAGKAVSTPLHFFGKKGSSITIMVLPTGKTPACSVMSRVGSIQDYKPLVSQLLSRLKQLEPGLKAGRAGTNGAGFIGGGRIVLLEPTGTQTAPAARIVTGISASEKK
jgi:hypothetical protein